MTPAIQWPRDLLALADAGALDARTHLAQGRVGNTIDRVRLRDGRWAVLKRGAPGEAAADVRAEAERLAWLDGLPHVRFAAPRLLWVGEVGDQAVSLVSFLPGRPAHLCGDDPHQTITLAAMALLDVHALPVEACPFGERRRGTDVVIHGDYALPNVLIDGERPGIVDWSLMRIGDRREDIEDAEKSIRRNFGASWIGMFRKAYGPEQ